MPQSSSRTELENIIIEDIDSNISCSRVKNVEGRRQAYVITFHRSLPSNNDRNPNKTTINKPPFCKKQSKTPVNMTIHTSNARFHQNKDIQGFLKVIDKKEHKVSANACKERIILRLNHLTWPAGSYSEPVRPVHSHPAP